VVFEYPANQFTQALIQIQSYREDNNDSQNALIGAQIYNDQSDVKFTIYGITNVDSWLTNYDMDVFEGKVRLLVNPIQDTVIQHFISYQVTWTGDLGLGVPMSTEFGSDLITETAKVFITTEG
jgi:hypothetical protein